MAFSPSNYFFRSGGSGSLTAPTKQAFSSTGTQSGLLFTISTSTTCAVGDTYTNNGNTYTVLNALSAVSGQVLYMSGTGGTSGATLTRATGAGTASVTFSANITLATYTLPAGTKWIKVTLIGGGGGGGGTASTAASAGTGGGGGGGGTCIKWIANPGTTWYYAAQSAGTGGSAGNNGGTNGGIAVFGASGITFITATGGAGGSGSAGNLSVIQYGSAGGLGGTGTGGDINIVGSDGGPGVTLSSTQALGGPGGTSTMGGSVQSRTSFSQAGNNGYNFGGGGGGGTEINNGGAFAGGNGGASLVFVEEFTQ